MRIGVHKCSKIIEYLLKAVKSIAQKYTPNSDLMDMMVTFTDMVNRCIKNRVKRRHTQYEKAIMSMLSRIERL